MTDLTSTSTPATAADVMTASPRTCSSFSSVLEAVLIFRDAGCGAVPIVDGNEPIGILTDRDVALAVADFPGIENRPVSDIMSKGVIVVPPTATLREIAATFDAHKVNRVLVVDSGGQLLGIVSRGDLKPYLR